MTSRRSSGIAAAWAGAVGLGRIWRVAYAAAPPVAAMADRRASRVVAVLAVVAAVVGTARRDVPLRPRLPRGAAGRSSVAGRGVAGGSPSWCGVRVHALVAARCATSARRFGESGPLRRGAARPGGARRSSPPSCAADRERLARVAGARARLEDVAARAGRLGLARPAHAAGRAARDDRGARGRLADDPARYHRPDARPRSTGWSGWSTTSSSCPGSTPACSRLSLRAGGARRRRQRGAWPARTRWRQGAAGCGSAVRSTTASGDRRPRRALARGRQPADERDPAHPCRRRRRGDRAGPWTTASS